jgi:hypothetical protein
MLPVWNVTPKFLKPLFKKILKLKYGFIHKLIYVFSVPLIDFEEFMIRVRDMPRMIWLTRKALTNDDWDKSYKDVFLSSSPIKVEEAHTVSGSKKKNYVNDIESLTRKKTGEAFKAKRRKKHFFHGAVNFPQ